MQLARNAEAARKMYAPRSHRYLLRTLVKCGECGLALNGMRQTCDHGKYAYLYYKCKGQDTLAVARTKPCASRRVLANRLDETVWQALCHLLREPELIPQVHQTWAEAKQENISTLEAQQGQLLQRRQRIERQDQRLLDAYQIEAINLNELQIRRQKLAAELQRIESELRQLAGTRGQIIHWRQVIDNADAFRKLLGDNLERLSFEERQAVAQCLIKKVVVTGEEVDIHFVLPFESSPQVINRSAKEPEGASGHFYRLRLTDHHLHLAVGEPLVERPRDRRPSQVVRREPSQPTVVAPPRHDQVGHPRRERLIELERAVVRMRLKEEGLRPARRRAGGNRRSLA